MDEQAKRRAGRPHNPDGRKVTRQGYVMLRKEDGKWELEHRLVAEQILGRKLEAHEKVSHKNGNRQDNDPNNLTLRTNIDLASR